MHSAQFLLYCPTQTLYRDCIAISIWCRMCVFACFFLSSLINVIRGKSPHVS